MSRVVLSVGLVLTASLAGAQPALERVTFDEAVKRATAHNPSMAEATQAIRRAEALLAEARTVFFPEVDGTVGVTVLDEARGFSGNVTQPRTQTAFGATAEFPVFAMSRWAEARQARDQVGIARLAGDDTRRAVAQTAAEAFLGVVAARRQLDISTRNRDTAVALAEYARIRLEAGQGSRLNHIRAAQELATSEGRVLAAELAVRQAQEALGVALFAQGPVDAEGDPELQVPADRGCGAESPAATTGAPCADEAWLAQRPDVRVLTAQLAAADRVVRDTWKSWLPEATAGFAPRYVTPSGFFEPSGTWRAYVQVEVPIYDGSLGAARRFREADRESARLRLEATKNVARAQLRTAQESVARHEQIVARSREAAEGAAEALRITEIAYRAGATTNVEVVQAQQTARNAETAHAQAEDRLRQAQLDLLVALGLFPSAR